MGEYDYTDFEKYRMTKNQETAEHSASLLAECLHSAAYTAVQMPLDAVTQIGNRITGSKGRIDLVDAPKPAEFGSDRWAAQAIGSGMGTVPLVMALNGASRLGGRIIFGAGCDTLGGALATGAVTGAMYQGVFSPVEDNDRFWSQKAVNALSGAVVFGNMAGFGKGWEAAGKRIFPPGSILRESLDSSNIARSAAIASSTMFTPINLDVALKERARLGD